VKFHFLSRKTTEPLSADSSDLGSQNRDPSANASAIPLAGSDQVPTPCPVGPPKSIDGNAEDRVESRAELVARLRQEIRDGTYEIPVPQVVKALTALLLRRR
jgi:hypothetical protein